ncbi:GrxA family glutaredoxin [Pseudoteredinibacter isoporae]|uniref:Glutaredoxin 1 n=1 Tax=Pseudoteredinibacter isoporae TaxID=570281 RepID=A0A7X0MYH4_9GAMM|nr:GrxA family glutaredoxin [Pseudoteredinibacter isoporae]MBB6523084.1 glutaredoxin 1 [Pseudoteredinibacter isoporae]NHO88604.1 GrxA family glutaredoxin [Pseudoteredinibacter isoporae]NIB22705.1 GrxA family glutaredoxin [Pseudoteredinibacter isoporae]
MSYTVFGRPGCGFCEQAKRLLGQKSLDFRYVDIHAEGISKADLEKTIGRPVRTVPQIFKGSEYVGGYTELAASLAEH